MRSNKKLYENETDIVKKMKYGRIFRDYDYKVLQIELQLNNIEPLFERK